MAGNGPSLPGMNYRSPSTSNSSLTSLTNSVSSVDRNAGSTRGLDVPRVMITRTHSSEVEGQVLQTTSNFSTVGGDQVQSEFQPKTRDSDDISIRTGSVFGRKTNVPVRNLGRADVAALVFNKMVGGGIFTTPVFVLRLTQRTDIGIGMWVGAGVYTGLSLLNYLQIGHRYPYNGGELIYLDRMYPAGFLFTLFFGVTHLLFPLTVGNCIAFAQFVTIAAQPSYESDSDLDDRVTKIVAIFALLVACVILAASPKLGMFLNKSFALYKFVLLIVVICAGFATTDTGTSENQSSSTEQCSYLKESSGSTDNSTRTWDLMGAFVLVVYSYSGWDNANYVAGELHDVSEGRTSHSLVFGALSTVSTTTVLYVLVVVAYYTSSKKHNDDIIKCAESFGMGSVWDTNRGFAHHIFGGNERAFRIMIATSAFGSLVSVAYTSAKVNQAIAKQRILPFWKFFQSDQHSPKGGLVLHFIINIIWIAALPLTPGGYKFVVGVSTWSRIFIEMLVMLGLPFRLKEIPFDEILLRSKPVTGLLSLAIALVNLVIIICAAGQQDNSIPQFWWVVILAGVFGIAFLYWGVVQLLNLPAKGPASNNMRHDELEMHPVRGGQPLIPSAGVVTIGQKIGIAVHVHETEKKDWPPSMNAAMNEAELDGTERRIVTSIGEPFIPAAAQRAWKGTVKWIAKYFC